MHGGRTTGSSSRGLVTKSRVARGPVTNAARTQAPLAHPGTAGPPSAVPLGERGIGGSGVVPGGGVWHGASLQADTSLSVPLALGGVVLVFIVVQWLIDRRDPKFVEAPARKDDDSIGFD